MGRGRRAVAVIGLLAVGAGAAGAPRFEPGRYVEADGAMPLHAGGSVVDPYFATKALVVADVAGLEVREAARRWVGWALARQRFDGRFERYCRDGQVWRACGDADADDAMLALWLELLYRLAPDAGIPAAWQTSVRTAEAHLASLRDPALGVYRIARTNPTALFMDNVEIHAALKAIARDQLRFGDARRARETDLQAAYLARDVLTVFWRAEAGAFVVSTQERPGRAFYPDVVAQTYPWLLDLPTPAGDPRPAFAEWRRRHGTDWLSLRQDDYPWGLVALTALGLGDAETARCWLGRAAPLRYGRRWNVLEEAIHQALVARLGAPASGPAPAC
jgi:hypothetical protein